jgi:hypothetical protein
MAARYSVISRVRRSGSYAALANCQSPAPPEKEAQQLAAQEHKQIKGGREKK